MGSLAEKGNADWDSGGNDNEIFSYSCLVERVCCGIHSGEQNYVLLTPKDGYGPGAVANLVEQSGLRLRCMTKLPAYTPMLDATHLYHVEENEDELT